MLYLGDGQIAEAVGTGVRARSLDEVVAEEQMVVAFRLPGVDAEHAERLRTWSLAQMGRQYNTVGVMLTAPFVLDRRLCELPLLPDAVRGFCMSGLLHMREGDVPSVSAIKPLRYVGHLKYNPPPLLAADGP